MRRHLCIKSLYRILRAETETTAPREVDTLEAGSLHASTPEAINPRSTAIGAQSVVSRFFSDCKNAVAASASFLAGARRVSRKSARDGKVWPETDVGIPLSTIKYQRNLRNVPFTSAMFRFIVKRMSIHHWILRLVSRANVPAFERTVTEMPLYSANGESMGPEKSISQSCFNIAMKFVFIANISYLQYTTVGLPTTGKTIWHSLLHIFQHRKLPSPYCWDPQEPKKGVF